MLQKKTHTEQAKGNGNGNHVVSLTTQIQTGLESMHIESMSQDSLKTPTLADALNDNRHGLNKQLQFCFHSVA